MREDRGARDQRRAPAGGGVRGQPWELGGPAEHMAGGEPARAVASPARPATHVDGGEPRVGSRELRDNGELSTGVGELWPWG